MTFISMFVTSSSADGSLNELPDFSLIFSISVNGKKMRENARGLLMNFELAKVSGKTPIFDFFGGNFW